MSLNNIELPASVIAGLYTTVLVEDNSPGVKKIPATAEVAVESSITAETDAAYKYLGNNRKNILVSVHNTAAVHLPDGELQFLTGILGACKLSMDDIALFNMNNHASTTYKELNTFFKSRVVLLFDIEPASFGLPLSFPHYQIQAFAGSSFLYAPSLKELENDKIEKSKLWVSLKRLFNL